MSSEECKAAIVEFVRANPGHVSSLFVGGTDEGPAGEARNWKRMSKGQEDGCVVRAFDCRPYDDQLRAYVWEKDGKIVRLTVEGE